MTTVAVLTDFVSHDPAYSLCGVVLAQAKMLHAGGLPYRVIVRKGWREPGDLYPGVQAVPVLDHGPDVGSNAVRITERSAEDVARLTVQLYQALQGVDVVLTHDLIYQPNAWLLHVAARRVAKKRSDLAWLHWVHSATNMGVSEQLGPFRQEVRPPWPNAKLVVMHDEELQRKSTLYRYEPDKVVVVPNAIDLCEGYHPLARRCVEEWELEDADVLAVYPCRLDRGKQPHVVAEVFAALRGMGYDARLVIVDFHSVGGDKAAYRREMKERAAADGLPLHFTSDLGGECSYHVPHKGVLDLFGFADMLVHASKSESDPLILQEAIWARCGLVLNFDNPVFRPYGGVSLQYKWSSAIDVHTGLPGETTTTYKDRAAYMRGCAGGVAYLVRHNPVLRAHAECRKTRGLRAVWRRNLWPAIEGLVAKGRRGGA